MTRTATTPPRPAPARPPGPRGRWVLGHTFDYMRDPLGFLTRCAREHGDLVRLRLGDTTVYAVNHPEGVEAVLRGHSSDVVKDKLTRLLCPLVGNGLLTSEGDFWRRQRKLAQPAFQHAQIERYGRVMVEQALKVREVWEAADGRPRDLHEDMGGLTLIITAQTLFGGDVTGWAHEVGAALRVMTDYYLNPFKWFRIREWLPTRENREFRRAVHTVDRLILDLIQARRSAAGSGGPDREPGDLLDRLLAAQDDDGSVMTDRQLRDECVTILLAGHETTALALTYAFHLLAHHPEADARLADELERELQGRPPTAADLPRLKYTEWVVREAMRVYPPAWALGREAVRPFELLGYEVPKGTQLFVSQWVVHRDPRWWPEPEAFRPERWDNDLAKRLPRGTYFPFGDGPRVCIGNHFAMMEAILVLATLAQRHRAEPVEGEALKLVPAITLRLDTGQRMVVRRR